MSFGLLIFAEYKCKKKQKKQKSKNPTIANLSGAAENVYDLFNLNGRVDPDVQDERDRVAMLRCRDLPQHELVVTKLQKVYGVFQRYTAVKGVSFMVDSGECFGLVGKNGAGKSSLLRMLVGATNITRGEAWVQAFNMHTERADVNKRIGFCPQFDALMDEWTAREQIHMHCALRGIEAGEETERITDIVSSELGFVPHLDEQTKLYNNGTKRKLSVALALIGDPAVVFFDEASTGMDWNAKHCLWNTMAKLQRMGKALVMTSHSMEECEAVCTRLSVMVKGEFRCFGTIEHLKDAFATRYTLIVNLWRSEPVERTGRESDDDDEDNDESGNAGRTVPDKIPEADTNR